MNNLRKYVLLITIMTAFSVIFSSETVLADKTVDAGKRGSVTIRYFDDVDSKTPVAGAEFTFYKIDDSSDLTTYTDMTNQDGILKISDMKLGRYRVVETSPAPGHKASASFLLTIPMTDHNEWLYDLTLEPKASLDLPTTSKSVYSVSDNPGASSLLQGGTYRAATSGTGLSASQTSRSGDMQGRRSNERTAKRASAARTGDESCSDFWIAVNILSGLAAAVFFLCGSAGYRRRKASSIIGIDN